VKKEAFLLIYEKELRFLCKVFEKSHIRASSVSIDELIYGRLPSPTNESFFGEFPTLGDTARAFMQRTVYKFKNKLGLSFICLLLPETDNALLVGPYHTASPNPLLLLELGEKNGVSPKRQKYFEEYMLGIPIMDSSSSLFIMLEHFCELIWESPSFPIVDVDSQEPIQPSPINESLHDDEFEDILVNMKAMEMRYAFENELLRAVSLGQLHKESQLISAFSAQAFEKRTQDPLRNVKNYGIIMNTLLRKAAEGGGVHPMYLDRVSSDFAKEIEELSGVSEITALMQKMFRAYCRLVRKHTIKHLSPVVQKTVLIIDSDLSADLSLSSLAASQSVSAGYLSSVFKKETGKTLSEYIREKRVKHASHLLKTTNLQIQTVALHCGIMDVHYFSKIFKKEMGLAPKEYRELSRQSQTV
jgi:AraC-like DNA-binding protein